MRGRRHHEPDAVDLPGDPQQRHLLRPLEDQRVPLALDRPRHQGLERAHRLDRGPRPPRLDGDLVGVHTDREHLRQVSVDLVGQLQDVRSSTKLLNDLRVATSCFSVRTGLRQLWQVLFQVRSHLCVVNPGPRRGERRGPFT
jgi:hypothetical protein